MKWHFYDATTGEYLGRTFSGPARMLKLNTPLNAVAVAADEFDPIGKKLNLNTGALEDCQSPIVDTLLTQHELDVKRARRQIADLERKQARALRETALGYESAHQRLIDIDSEIASLREIVNG